MDRELTTLPFPSHPLKTPPPPSPPLLKQSPLLCNEIACYEIANYGDVTSRNFSRRSLLDQHFIIGYYWIWWHAALSTRALVITNGTSPPPTHQEKPLHPQKSSWWVLSISIILPSFRVKKMMMTTMTMTSKIPIFWVPFNNAIITIKSDEEEGEVGGEGRGQW